MSKKLSPPTNIDNPFISIVQTPDGRVKREVPDPRVPADSDPDGDTPVITKDVPLNPDHSTFLRLYLPRSAAHTASPTKIPLIVYFHGGGYIFCHADSAIYDVFCRGIAAHANAVVVSVEYRLAPEHRLPAAYEDAMEALHWIKTSKEEWLVNYADTSNCYLSGTSAGGNLAYHAGLRAASAATDLEPLRIQGLILHDPYFGGTIRTESEERCADDSLLPLYSIDQMFDLCLPVGADRDHEYCNPVANGGSTRIDKIRSLGWRVMVTGDEDDPLVDRCRECAELLENKGIQTVKFFNEGYHAKEIFDPSTSPPLFAAISRFISST